jgi:TatD DNase family protein
MTAHLIDTHCHLDSESFRQELEDVIARAESNGVTTLLTIGVTLESSQAAVVLADRFPAVRAVVGIQPNYVHHANAGDWDAIVNLAAHPRVVGVGETGLDQYWDTSPFEMQQDYFRRHIELSRAVNKPFVVHCREAEGPVIELLTEQRAHGPLHGVMHSFCGNADHAQSCLALGMYISFAGMVTFKKNEHMRNVAKTVPLDRLLIETDAPYLAPHPNRGKRNEPAWVRFTAECLAAVHGITLDELASVTSENARRLFQIGSLI